jgi:Tol biopolymer transport system component
VEIEGTEYLYFSSSRAPARGGFVPGEIFMSERAGDGFGPGAAVGALNDATANDIQPNIRKDGRELVYSSDRGGGLGGQDIWIATRGTTSDAWSTPVNLGSTVNTAAAESRPSLSWNAEQLLFGRAPGPEGQSDIYVWTRDRSERSEDR